MPQQSMQRPSQGVQGPSASSSIMQAVQGMKGSNDRQGSQPNRGHRQGPNQDQGRNERQQQDGSGQGQNNQRGGRNAPVSASSQPGQLQQQQGENRQGQGRTLPLPPKLPLPGSQGPPAASQVRQMIKDLHIRCVWDWLQLHLVLLHDHFYLSYLVSNHYSCHHQN